MWTYLAIFFSLALFLGVFLRRAVLMSREKDQPEEKKTELETDPTEKAKKVRLDKDEKEDVQNLYNRGEALLNAGKDDEAIKCFVQALSIHQDHLETQQKLAMLYLQKQMYGAASAMFQRLADLTNDPIHYSHWGLALYQQSSFEQAKLAYQKAIILDSSRPQRFVSLSQVYRAMGQGYNAMIALNKALELDEKKIDFLYLMADLQMELGNLEEAAAGLKKILEIDPKNPEAGLLMKETERIKKEKEEAQKN